MTWPEHQRSECRYKGFVTKLTTQERDALAAILLRGAHGSSVDLLTEVLWRDDPDGGAASAADRVRHVIGSLRRKLPGAIGGRLGYGWFLTQFYRDKVA